MLQEAHVETNEPRSITAGAREKASCIDVDFSVGDATDTEAKALCLDVSKDILVSILAALNVIDQNTLIFSVPLVCRRWREVCRSHLLRADIQLKIVKRPCSEIPRFIDTLHAFTHRFRSVRKFALWLHWSTSADGIGAVVAAFPNLTALNLTSSNNVTDAELEKIASGCSNLTALNLTYCSNVTDTGLQRIAAGCAHLRSLNLNHCFRLTDIGMEKIAAGCPNLASLNLYNCTNLTDRGLELIAAGCPGLTSLVLTHCSELTDAALYWIVERCTNLASLNLAFCTGMTHDGKALFRPGVVQDAPQ
jgi:hypothetical protein